MDNPVVNGYYTGNKHEQHISIDWSILHYQVCFAESPLIAMIGNDRYRTCTSGQLCLSTRNELVDNRIIIEYVGWPPNNSPIIGDDLGKIGEFLQETD